MIFPICYIRNEIALFDKVYTQMGPVEIIHLAMETFHFVLILLCFNQRTNKQSFANITI